MSTTAGPVADSIRRRLRRRLLLALGGLWFLAGLSSVAWQYHETNEVLDSALTEVAQRVLSLPTSEGTVALMPHEETIQLQLLDQDGSVLWHSHAAQPLITLPSHSWLATQGDRRIAVQRAPDGSRYGVASEDLHERREALLAALLTVLWSTMIVVPLAAWTIRWALREGLRPLDALGARLQHRHPEDDRPESAAGLPRELHPLVEAINALLARVTAHVHSERSFTRHAAHELRTPVAGARAQAQRLAALATDDTTRAHAQAVIRKLDALTRLSERLLQLARIDADQASYPAQAVDLTRLTAWVLREAAETQRTQARAAVDRVELVAPREPVRVAGDPDLLAVAIRNLIDNALHHAPDANIVVEVEESGAVTVSDDGPGIPVESLTRLQRPFERGATQADGLGLGLSIVRAVAQRYQGRLILRSPHQGGRGLHARLELKPWLSGLSAEVAEGAPREWTRPVPAATRQAGPSALP